MKLDQYKALLLDDEEDKPVKKGKFLNDKVILTVEGAILTKKQIDDLKKMGIIKTGIPFDSKLEAQYYRDQLLPRINRLEIDVELQPKFTLLKGFTTMQGKKHLPITYSPDFKITYRIDAEHPAGHTVVVDTKGFEDQKFPIKRKMFDYFFPEIELQVIKHVIKYGGWIPVEEYTKIKSKEKRDAKKLGLQPTKKKTAPRRGRR